MTRDANVGLYFLDKPARRRAAYRLAADNAVAFRLVGRRMADHQERTMAAHLLVALLKRCVDFVLGQLGRRPKRGDIRAAASEDRESIEYHALPVQRDSLGFEVGDHFALIEVARNRKYSRARAAHVVDYLARVLDAAKVGKIARYDHQVSVAQNLAHPLEIARRHVHIAK